MKKIYLLLVLCCLSYVGSATKWYSGTLGPVNNVNNWFSTPIGGTNPLDFTTSTTGDTFVIQTNVNIASGGTWDVWGTVIDSISNTFLRKSPGPGNVTISIRGDLILKKNTRIFSAANSTGLLTINIGGNLDIRDSAYINSTSSFVPLNPTIGQCYTHIHFVDTATLAAPKTISWSKFVDSAQNKFTSIYIDNRSVRKLLSDVPLPIYSQGNFVSPGGTLICDVYKMHAHELSDFTIDDGAHFYTAHANGIDHSIQYMMTRNFSTEAHYYYNGKVAQTTGTTLPNNFSAGGSVTIMNNTGVQLSQSTIFAAGSMVNLDYGIFDHTNQLTMASNSLVNVDSGDFASAPMYNPGVDVTYKNIGLDGDLSIESGWALRPILAAGVGNLTIDKPLPGSVVSLNSNVTINGNILLKAGILDAGGFTGGPFAITAKGNWTNNSGMGGYSQSFGGIVKLAGTVPQVIGGAFPTRFGLVEVNNTGGGVTIDTTTYIEDQLTFYNGTIDINKDTLVMDFLAPPIVAVPGFDNSRMIIADNTGVVTKISFGGEAYFFPIGDAANYAPINVNMTDGFAMGSSSWMGVNASALKHPNNANVTNHTTRYWRVYMHEMFFPEYTVTANYADADIVGTEANISMGKYAGSLPWTKYGPAVAGSNALTATAVLEDFAEFTGISTPPPSLVGPLDVRICDSASATLTATSPNGDPGLTYKWSPTTNLSATNALTSVVSSSVTGVTTYTITITDGNGFEGYATTTVTIDPTPRLTSIKAYGDVMDNAACLNTNLQLQAVPSPSSAINTYSWAGPVAISTGGTTANETVNTVTPSASGVYTLTISNGTEPGCTAVHMTQAVTVNPLPGAPTVTTEGGLSEFCVSTVFTVTATGASVYYQGSTSGGVSLTDPVLLPMTVSSTGIYYFRSLDPATACWGGEVSKAVTINPLPVEYQVTVNGLLTDGTYCQNGSGLNVGLTGSELGVKYILYNDGVATEDTLDGTGAALDYGVFTKVGGYTVLAKNPTTGCEQPYTGVPVRIDTVALPTQYPMNGNGYYCEGSGGSYNVILLGSDPGVEYQLYHRDTAAGALPVAVGTPIPGTLGDLDFGPYSAVGTYSIIATNFISGLGCNIAIDSTDSIYVHPLPNIYAMMGLNDTICEGFGALSNVNLKFNGPDIGVDYYLYENGDEKTYMEGGGALLDFLRWPSVGTPPGTYIYTIEARDSACRVMMAGGDTIIVAPAPFRYDVSGGGAYCAGMPDSFSIYISNSDLDIRYEVTDLFYNPLMPAVDGTGGFLEVGKTSDPLMYSVLATNTITGCTAVMNGEAEIRSNGLPTTEGLLGGGHYCDGVPPGVNISMTGYTPDPNIQYSLYRVDAGGDVLVSTISESSDFGMHMTGGRYYATVRNVATTCAGVVNDTVEVVIDSLPHVQDVTGGGAYCANDVTSKTVGLSNSQIGIDYTLFRDGTDIGVYAGTGVALNFGSTVVTGIYTVAAKNPVTGCESNMSGSAKIIEHPIPVAFDVNGGGRYCEGSGGPLVTLTGSEIDINYQLYRNGMAWGAPLSGTTMGLNFGGQDSNGVYTVIATNTATSCQNAMDSFAFVTIKPIPVVFDVAGAGPYCSGDTGQHVYLSASYVGTEYQLLRDGNPEGAPMAGTGFGLDFGLFTTPGSYTVVAKLLSDSCTLNMRYTVVLYINPKPTVFSVSGGGTICADSAGVPIDLSGSEMNVRYQVYSGTTPVGTPVDGTGSRISFGRYNVAGTYKVVATSLLTACVDTMSGTATVVVNPLPTPFAVTGGGDYCEGDGGLHIGLANSETGVMYQPYYVDTAANYGGPIMGTGSALDFGLVPTGGTYIVYATGPTGCKSTMTGSANIIVNPLPDVFFVSGGGSYCEGGSGVLVLLSGSKPGVEYQLFAGSSATGTPRMGTGSVINFGYQRADSTYTVMATNTVTNCTKKMDGNAVVTIIPYAAPTVTLTASPSTLIAVGEKATVTATVTGSGIGTPTFAWRINRNPVPGEYGNTLNFTMYYDNDTIECDVMSHGVCGGIVTTKQIIFHLKPVGVQQIASLNGVIRLVPNPNKGVFSLKGSLGIAADEELHAEVTNMLGQVVYSSKITARNGEVDEQIQLGGNLANGMYLLNLRGNNARGVFHFVVEQ